VATQTETRRLKDKLGSTRLGKRGVGVPKDRSGVGREQGVRIKRMRGGCRKNSEVMKPVQKLRYYSIWIKNGGYGSYLRSFWTCLKEAKRAGGKWGRTGGANGQGIKVLRSSYEKVGRQIKMRICARLPKMSKTVRAYTHIKESVFNGNAGKQIRKTTGTYFVGIMTNQMR